VTPARADISATVRVAVVHLVWAPLGPEPLRAFLRSYAEHPAGLEHDLVIVLNGERGQTSDPRVRESLLAPLAGVEHRLIALERPMLDMPAYGTALRELEHEQICLLNSYSVLLADRWLALLSRALEQPDVGIAGATGSFESQAEWVRGRVRHWPYQLAGLKRARRDYPRFPNPHLRTTGIIASRALLAALDLHEATDKRATYLLESGREGLTRRVAEVGMRAVVVGADGRPCEPDLWAQSATYRSSRQQNLLISDNRTREWDAARPRLKRRLSRDAWGESYPLQGA
jgi:hypothetical protein